MTPESLGKFALRQLFASPRRHRDSGVGFRPDMAIVDLATDESLSTEIRLRRNVTSLHEVRVSESAAAVPAKLVGFGECRKSRTAGILSAAR